MWFGVNGFIDACVLSFNFTMVAFLSVIFIDLCTVLLFSSYTVNEIDGLFCSKVVYVVFVKSYLSS